MYQIHVGGISRAANPGTLHGYALLMLVADPNSTRKSRGFLVIPILEETLESQGSSLIVLPVNTVNKNISIPVFIKFPDV